MTTAALDAFIKITRLKTPKTVADKFTASGDHLAEITILARSCQCTVVAVLTVIGIAAVFAVLCPDIGVSHFRHYPVQSSQLFKKRPGRVIQPAIS
jgi:hypothetical protein